MNLKDAVNYEYSEQDMIKPLKNITLSEADSTETFDFKPFEYERGTVTKTAKGIINTIRDMQDIPEQVKIFGKRISFGFGGYFGDTEEETERKKLNLVTAERNLNEAQAERYKYTSPKETESLSYGIGGGIVNYGTMLVPAGLVGGGLKAAGAGAKAISTGAEIAGLGTMSVMELAGQVQDKTPEKDGEIDIEAMTPEWARKATGGTIAYTGLSALTEKYVGFGKQMKMWNKPIQWGGNVTSKALTTLRTAGTNALSEGATEGIQDLEATGIGLIDGTLTMDKLPARLQQAWKSAIIGGIIGGGVGTAAAMKSARNVKKQLREMVAPVVGEKDANTVAEAIYNAGTDDMTKAISIELELSSELKNKHGKVWNSMLTAVTKEMEGKPRFEGWSEDQKAHYANTVAKHFADQTLAEANFRGTTLDAILRASDITWNKGIRLARHINLFDALKNPEMIPPETKLKRESLLAFLKRQGGLQDYGGELKSRDAQKLYPGIVSKNGMNFDDAALMAWENGYFPSKTERPDINEFLEAVDEGLRGNHRYNVEEERNFSDAIEDLREELDRLGIDYENMTAAEIEKAVDEIPELKSLEREAAFYEQYEPEIGLSEDEAERFAMETEGKQYPVIEDKDLPEYYQIAEENAQLDAENPAYEGETITINGQEKTVYNSDGERIAQSKEALENFYKWFGDSKVVDEQGRPLVVYHGSDSNFEVFDRTKTRSTMDIQGNFFSPWELDAQGYGQNVRAFYLSIQNPASSNVGYKALKKFQGQNDAGIKAREELENMGYDGVNNDDEEYIAFESNQIKSTQNRGTYSASDNIYYQMSSKEITENLLRDIKKTLTKPVSSEVLSKTISTFNKTQGGRGYTETGDSVQAEIARSQGLATAQEISKAFKNKGINISISTIENSQVADEWHHIGKNMKKANFYDVENFDIDELLQEQKQEIREKERDKLFKDNVKKLGLDKLKDDDLYKKYQEATGEKYGSFDSTVRMFDSRRKAKNYLYSFIIQNTQTEFEQKNKVAQGTYSESENIYYQTGEDRDLVALHSISAGNLERAIDFGGFPVPSIAIVKKGQEFHFDDLPITLVSNKEMIDPYDERNEVYNRDVWSKTFPFKTYKNPTEAKVKKFKDKYEGYFKKSASKNQLGSFIYQVQRLNPASAFNEYKNSSGMILYYLENIKGEKVELKKKDVASDVLSMAGIDEELANKIKELDVEVDREKIGKAYLAMQEKKIAEDFADIQDEEKKNKLIKLSRKMLLENKFDKDGKLYFSVADTIVTAAKRYFEAKGEKVLDYYEVSRFLREKVEDDAKYEEWAEKTFEDDLVGNPMVEVGNKLKPFTIGNVVDAMILGNTVASQNALFGSGKIIASGAKKLETIRDIKEEGKKLVSKEQSQKNMEEVNEQIDTFTRYFMDKNDFQQNMDRKTASGEALAQVVKNKNITKESLQKALNKYLVGKEKYSDEALSYGIQVAKNIKNLVRYYFEAKPQRAVGLNEFSGAIMPTSTEFDAIAKKAENAGLKVVRSDNQTEALEQFDNVYFQRGKNAQGSTKITPDEYIIKLLEEADESTLPHEFAHYWLTEMWNYTKTGRASENYMKRWNTIADYLEVKPEQTRLTRGQQEKFASSYEAYLTRGELPTPLIGSVFDDYDKWLQQVYKDYNKINYQSGFGKRRVRLTDAAIKFFQSMTTGTLEAPALAPKNTGVAIPEKTEEVIKPTNEVVETPATYETTRVINITEGEKGVSKVYQREAMKHADRIVDELGVSYNKINLEEQAVKATEWVQNNLDEARKVVNGAPSPEGIIDTAIFIAYENEMLRIGNNAEYQRVLKIHSQVQTQRGQAIAAERITTDDVNNPAYWWKKLQKSQETNVARKLFKGDVKALNEAVETETKSIMKQIAGKPKEEQVEALTKLAEKLQKDYNLDTLYQMPDEVNERTVKEFVKDVFGINPDLITGNEVINKAEQLQKLWDNTKDDSGNPSVEAMRAKRELNDLIQTRNPSSTLAIWTSIFGRGVMLMSVKSPVLNVISNIEAGLTEGITRRIMYGATEKAVDKTVKEKFSKYAWEVYKASGDIVSTMNNYDDDMRVIGEQILHSQGQGALRAASRKVEEVSFKYLMGAPDAWFKRLAFNDTADLLATKIAREEGAKDISKRATEIYKDAILIKPQTEQGQLVRQKAQEQAHYTTFTNDSWAAKFGLSARNWLNMVGRNKVRLGDLTMKFVKTPANVQMMGLEYGFGSLYTLYNIQEIIKNPQSEVSQHAIRAAVRNGLGIALAALLYSMLDPEDYFSEFDTLNPKEKDRMRAMGAMPNSIKIGNRWVSLDYFGQIAIPLVGMLEARRNNGLRSYIQSGLTQAAKIPGIKETKQLIDTMSEYARYDLKPEKIVQMIAGTVLDQARAMTIPAIVNDIAKMTDDYERDTMGGVFDKVFASIPGLRQTLPERYGIQGIIETEPALSTLLFGSRVKTVQEDKLVREINKLSTKDEQPSISDVTKYGNLRLLSAEKKVRVRKEFYKFYNSESKKLISTRAYKKKSPEEQKKALNKVRNRVIKSLKEKYSNDIKREKRR